MINLYGLEIRKLEKLMLEEGQTKYRATQLYSWLYEKGAQSFDEMTDVSLRFRDVLKEKYCFLIENLSQNGNILKGYFVMESLSFMLSFGTIIGLQLLKHLDFK